MTTYAEELPYWKTSSSAPDKWTDKACLEIERAGGIIEGEGFGREAGSSAFLLRFSIDGDKYKVVWPVLTSKLDERQAAKRQAATMLYHDVKAMCVKARALGARIAFFAHMEMADGRVASQLGPGEYPEFPLLLGPGDVIDAEVVR